MGRRRRDALRDARFGERMRFGRAGGKENGGFRRDGRLVAGLAGAGQGGPELAYSGPK